jgi:thiol-disulfide isomerase/thioredoxin
MAIGPVIIREFIMLRRFFSSTAWLVAISLLTTSPALVAEEVLTIGSDAPALDVEHWVQDGNGKFKPVTKFAKGKVYVVEFWATWCGPCILSMPHLAELQKEYTPKGVQIVSISDEDLETVQKFLEREVQSKGKAAAKGEDDKEQAKDDKPKTYKELTSAYCLTTDPDRSAYADYMEAAGQGGIPTAFIVGKDQKIEWIGHPMSMDEVLADVVSGKWDREAFAKEFKAQQELDLLMNKVRVAMSAGNTKEALAAINAALENAKEGQMSEQLQIMRLQIQLNDKGSKDQLPEILAAAYKKYASQPQLINVIAWTVVEQIESGELKKDKALIDATRAAIEKVADQGTGDARANTLDTVAHVQFLSDDVDAAIKTETEAIEIASSQMKPQQKEYLKTLQEAKEKATKEKPAK